jgi:hypothetical protein
MSSELSQIPPYKVVVRNLSNGDLNCKVAVFNFSTLDELINGIANNFMIPLDKLSVISSGKLLTNATYPELLEKIRNNKNPVTIYAVNIVIPPKTGGARKHSRKTAKKVSRKKVSRKKVSRKKVSRKKVSRK